jgi:formylglycine-generating enzyme required for sulfatase activity/tRNA A-37 threonylcarbamoyl transferase component Bud32
MKSDSDRSRSAGTPEPEQGEGASAQVLERLQNRIGKESRYQIQGEFARGGMGAILKVWDQDLRRTLAMKVVLGKAESEQKGSTPAIDEKSLGRFLEEAQITGQLDHPGIVPVYELGMDTDGQVFFTMRLVKGRDLKHIFDLVRDGREGWTQTRALTVLLKVCEAMAYAHSKGVIHRDLKPANIMVGRFGEVYVMDWGLAKVLGREDTRDLRIKAPETTGSLHTEGREEREQNPDTPLVTMDGAVVGTPAYMPPEQARGDVEKLDRRSDVYALGAMLYHLLTGQMPYVVPGMETTPHAIWRWVLEGRPQPIGEMTRSVSAELTAVCEKAMSRESRGRYEDMSELADDLAAYLDGRVVRAHRTGAIAELGKWVSRNRALAAVGIAFILLAFSGLGAVGYVEAQGRKAANAQRLVAEENARKAVAAAEETRQQEAIARQERANAVRLSSLSDRTRAMELRSEAEKLWPAHPENIAELRAWIERAGEVAARKEVHKKEYERIGKLAIVSPEAGGEWWEFEDPELQWRHGQLMGLTYEIAGLERTIEHVERRLQFALGVEELTITGENASRRWAEACASIRNETESPAYRGLRIEPQLGLLPIGRDSRSGLWEFCHPQTGDVPDLDAASGDLVLTEKTSLIFVLVPSGTFQMGAQKGNPSEPNYHPMAGWGEAPVHAVQLDAFFLSKYEMTWAQWMVGSEGVNPSPVVFEEDLGVQPASYVSWTESHDATTRLGLVLPTEAQWEYAARAGTNTAWWTGDRIETLIGAANLVGPGAAHIGDTSPGVSDWAGFDDGHEHQSAVGRLAPNPFGLHDVHGNALEWCHDYYGDYTAGVADGDGLRLGRTGGARVARGGSHNDSAKSARSSNRYSLQPGFKVHYLGLRPARRVSD